MRLKDFRLEAVQDIVRDQPRTFYSREVWDDRRLRDVLNPTTRAEEHSYRRQTGRFLSKHRRTLRIRWMSHGPVAIGSRWEREDA